MFKRTGLTYLLASIAFFAAINLSHAQTELDSLTRLFEQTKGTNLTEVQLLNDVAEQFSSSYPSIAEQFASRALDMAKELSNKAEEANAHLNLGDIFRTRSDLTKALEHGFHAYNILEELSDSSSLAIAANAVGLYYSDIGNWDQATEYYNKSLSLNTSDAQTRGQTFNRIGSMYQYRDEFDSAEYYFNEALKIQLEARDLKGLAITYGNIGIIHSQNRNFEKAYEFYSKSIEMKKQLVDLFNLTYSYINMGNLHRNFGLYEKARGYYELALSYTDSTEAKYVKSAIYERWAKSERLAGNADFSGELMEKGLRARIEILRDREKSKIDQLEAGYNLEKRERELLISNQNIQILEQDRRIQLTQIALLILALLLMVFIFFWQRIRSQRAKEIQQAKNELLTSEVEHKNNELSTFTLNFIQKQDMMNELATTLKDLKRDACPPEVKQKISKLDQVVSQQARNDREWEDFRIYFEKVHSNFFKNLKAEFPELSITEQRLAALTKLKLSIKETASILGISPDSIKTARHRLRKRLNLDREENLTDYLSRFEG